MMSAAARVHLRMAAVGKRLDASLAEDWIRSLP
jgi:hypothetical protein